MLGLKDGGSRTMDGFGDAVHLELAVGRFLLFTCVEWGPLGWLDTDMIGLIDWIPVGRWGC